MEDLKKSCQNLLLKENRFLKLIFIIIASWLIFYSTYTFVVLKPTYSSEEKREISAEDFPEVMICPEPTFDIQSLLSRGHRDYFGYFVGSKQFGWAGKNFEDVEKVYREISPFKTISDCPRASHRFKDIQRKSRADLYLEKALYPYHLCCKISPPKESQSYVLNYLNIFMNGSNLRSFKVFLADQMTASFYDLHKRTMLGDKLTSHDNGWMNYNVKIMEDVKLEGDPKYPCIEYKERGEYAKCLENEIVSKVLHFMNCTPPWMTDDDKLWCRRGKAIQTSNAADYTAFMRDITVSQVKPEKCLVPCKMKRYLAKEIGLRERQNVKGLIIRFENEVDIIKSSWKMDVETLLSEMGGFIGLNKNFLWIITLSLSTMGILCSNIKLKLLPKTI